MAKLNKKSGDYPTKDNEYSFSDWLNDQMSEKGIKIQQIADDSGITYTGIWNIVQGYTWSPRAETREKIAKAIGSEVPEEIQKSSDAEVDLMNSFELKPCENPFDAATVPNASGVYVIYDVTHRPVYIGQSAKSMRGRIKDHQTRFWYKDPVVARLSVIEINDPVLCRQIENILIAFLGPHALLNKNGANRDMRENLFNE